VTTNERIYATQPTYSQDHNYDGVATLNALPLKSPQCRSVEVILHMAPFCSKQRAIYSDAKYCRNSFKFIRQVSLV